MRDELNMRTDVETGSVFFFFFLSSENKLDLHVFFKANAPMLL